jgi:hypothetical protein
MLTQGMNRRRAFALLVFAVLLGCPAAATPLSPEAARERAYADPGLQQTLPPAAMDPADLSATADLSALDQLLRWLGKGGILASIVRLLAIGAATVAAILAVLWLVKRFSERGDVYGRADAPQSMVLDVAPLLEADTLAGQARFREAIHLLLLRTFEILARRAGSALAPGMTGREVLHRLGLPETVRPAIADLVDAVEATAFAGRSASLEDYQRCAGRFSVLQQVLGGASA